MGFSISWVAFKGLGEADVLRRAGFHGTGQAADLAGDRAPFTFALMFSAAAMFANGHEMWRVAHDSSKGPYDLATVGTMPAEFEPVRRDLMEKQTSGREANVDFV